MTKRISIGEVTCNMCGDTYYYKGGFNGQVSKDKDYIETPMSWVHEFNLNSIGYGSFFDMSSCTIHICDKCLKDVFKDMEVKPFISGDGIHSYGRVVQLIEGAIGSSITNIPIDKVYEIADIISEMDDPTISELSVKLQDFI